MTLRSFPSLPCAVAALALLAGCGLGERHAGTGISTGNARVAGTAMRDSGAPAAGALVYLLPDDADPVADREALLRYRGSTDGSGRFEVSVPAHDGKYNLLIRDTVRGIASLLRDLDIPGGTRSEVPGQRLERVSAAVLPAGDLPRVAGYAYLPGTDMQASADPMNPNIRLTGLPAGTYPSLAFKGPGLGTTPLVKEIALRSETGKDADLDPWKAWPSYRFLNLNTAAPPWKTTSAVADFPASLVIDAGWQGVDFTDPARHDFRFHSRTDRPYPYHISYRNAATRKILAWIRIDTLQPAAAGQGFWARWRPGPDSGSQPSPAVFDTAAGFNAVWHLDEPVVPNGDSLYLADGTGHGYVGRTLQPSSSRNGILGMGLGLDSATRVAVGRPVIDLGGEFTALFWIRLEAPGGAALAKSGGAGGGAKAFAFLDSSGGPGYLPAFRDGAGPDIIGRKPLAAGSWHHIAFRRQAGKDAVDLFIDGSPVGTDTRPGAGGVTALSPDAADGTWFLGAAEGASVKGDLDEVWLLRRAMPDDWIRLLYGNQVPGGGFP